MKKKWILLGMAAMMIWCQNVAATQVTNDIDIIMAEQEAGSTIELDQPEVTLKDTSLTTLTRTIGVSDTTGDGKSFTIERENRTEDVPHIVEIVSTNDSEFKIKGLNYGTEVITVKSSDGTKTATCTVNVQCTGFSIKNVDESNKMTVSLKPGDKDFSVAIEPIFSQEGFSFPMEQIMFSSNNRFVAQIVEHNKIKPISAGEAEITAKIYKDQNFGNASSDVEVKFKVVVNSPVTSIEENDVTLTPGKTYKLNPLVLPADATDRTIKYMQDEATKYVATVDEHGNITAKAPGITEITICAVDGSNVTKTIKVTVNQPVSDIKLDKDEYWCYEGQNFNLSKPIILPADATDKSYKYIVSNEKVLSVDENGYVTTKEAGASIITVMALDGSGKSANIKVDVRGQIEGFSAKTNSAETEVESEGRITFHTSVSANDAYISSIKAEAKDPSIVSVKGIVKSGKNENTELIFEGLKVGETEIIVTSNNQTKKDVTITFHVKVIKKSESVVTVTESKEANNVTYKIDGTTATVSDTTGAMGAVKIAASVKIGDKTYKVTKIADGAFKGNKSITKITIPSSVTTVGKRAFYGCNKLTAVTIGANVTTISDEAFAGCKALKKVTIPSKITKIGKKAFYNCKVLKTVTVKGNKIKSVGANAFKGLAAKSSIKVPKAKLAAYKKKFKGKYTVNRTTIV